MSGPSLPTSQLAWQHTARGPPRSVLRLHHIPLPTTSPSQLLIRVSHASFTPSIAVLMSYIPSLPLPPLRAARAWTPELELSGEVCGVGAALQAPAKDREGRIWKEGMHVVVALEMASLVAPQGALQEYVAVGAERCTVITGDDERDGDGDSRSSTLVQAAGVSSSSNTSLRMLRCGRVRAGDTVLINGVSGGTGLVLAQMALRRGARVVGVCSAGNEQLVRGVVRRMVALEARGGEDGTVEGDGELFAGRLEIVDYTRFAGGAEMARWLGERYGDGKGGQGKGLDAVLDCVGTVALYDGSAAFLKRDGVYVNIGAFEGPWRMLAWTFRATLLPAWLGGGPRKYVMTSGDVAAEDQRKVVGMWQKKEFEVAVDSVWNMEDVLEAYDRLASKRAKGKVVVKVQNTST